MKVNGSVHTERWAVMLRIGVGRKKSLEARSGDAYFSNSKKKTRDTRRQSDRKETLHLYKMSAVSKRLFL